jgi:hypothetical protein
MIRKGIVIFVFIMACVLPRIACGGSAPVVSFEKNISTNNLGVPTVFSNFCTQEFRQEGYIKLAMQAYLEAASFGREEFSIEQLRNFARKNKSSLFNGTHFFFDEPSEPMSFKLSAKEYGVMCRMSLFGKSEKDIVTYYVVFTPEENEAGGFPVKIYTEDAWCGVDEADIPYDAARRVGKTLAPPDVSAKYTLFTSVDIYRNGTEYRQDIEKYGSRFNLEIVKMNKEPEVYVEKIIEAFASNPNLDPRTVIVQLPKDFISEEYWGVIDKLISKASGIRFMIMDVAAFRKAPQRAQCREAMYAGMLLTRKIEKKSLEKIPELKTFFRNYFGILTEKNEGDTYLADMCIEALVRGETDAFKKILFVPIKKKSIIRDTRESTKALIFA